MNDAHASVDCTPGVFAYWSFEDCSPGSNTPNDGMAVTATSLNGCPDLTVSELLRNASGNSCQVRDDNTIAVCMGSATETSFVDNSDKAITFSLTFPAGSTGKLTSINFETMVPTLVDFNNSGSGDLNNYPTKWGIRVLKNGTEIYKLVDQPLIVDTFTLNDVDFTSDPDFEITGGDVFSFEINGYLPAGVPGAGRREIWDLDEVKVNGYCGTCATCGVTLAATPGTCDPATNQYTVTGTISLTNAVAGTATITDGSATTTVSIATTDTSVPFTLAGQTSDGASHTISVDLPNCGTNMTTYTAPASCTVAPPVLAVLVTNPICNSLTNQYTATGTVSLTNATAGTLTITDNATSLTVITVTAGQTTASFSVSGISNAASHTLIATLTGGTSASTVYAAPASCTVCSTSITTTALANGQVGSAYSQTIAVSGASGSLTFSTTGSLPAGLSLNPTTGVISGTPTAATTTSFTVRVTDSKSCSDAQALSITTSSAPVCSLTATATPGVCNSATNTYTVTGMVSATNTPANQSLTVSVGSTSTVVTLTGNGPVSYTLTGLTSDGAVKTVSVVSSATTCGMASVTYTAPASCSIAPPSPPALAVVVTNPICNSLTNQYTATGTVSLTNAVAGTLTITDNGTSIGVVSITAGQTTASFSVSGISNAASHTLIATLTGGTSASTVYAAPASCTVCSTSITTTALANGQVGSAYSQTIAVSGASGSLTFSTTGSLPAGLSLNPTTGVISGTPTAATTTSFTVRVTDSKSCSDAQALSITTSSAPVCSLTATATPGVCNTATNTYTVTGTVSATNTPANQSLTISIGSITTVVTLTGNGPVSYTLTGLSSDGLVKTVSVVSSATACGMASVTYTAPASCSIAPPAPPALAVLVTNPVCNSLTNQYTATGTVSLTNAVAGSLTITDNGTSIGVVSITAGQTTASFSVSGISNAASHTLIATLTGGTSASTTYSAPASCTVCSTSITTTALASGQVGTPYSQTIAVSGAAGSLTFSTTGSLPAGLSLNPTTGVISGTPTAATTTSFTVRVTDSKSCSDAQPLTITTSSAPVCSLTATATPGVCNSATNTYSAIVSVTLVNPQAGVLTLTNGTSSQTVAVTNSTTGATGTFVGLPADGLTRTISASLVGCGLVTTNYTAPQACSITPTCSISAQVTASQCNSATNQYSTTVVVTVTNPLAGTVSITQAGITQTLSTSAGFSSNVLTAVYNGLVSDGMPKTVTILSSATACGSTSVSYTAPQSCSTATPVCALTVTATPGQCTNDMYSVSGTVVAQNATGTQSLTITDGSKTTTVTLTGNGPANFTLSGLTADALTHTIAVTSSATVCSQAFTTYSAPAACNVQACKAGVFAYWAFEDCSPGSKTVRDGFEPTSQNLVGCSSLSVSAFSRGVSGNSCQQRTDGTLAVCMGSSDLPAWVDNSSKSLSFSMTYPAGSVGQLTSISFDANSPSVVDFNLSGTGEVNNSPTKWGIRVLKNGVEIFKLIDQPLTIDLWKTYMVDWSTNPAFAINGATTFSVEINGYAPVGTTGTIREIWDIDEVKVNGYCGSCCSLSATATPTACNSATNQYSVSGTISLTGNAAGGIVTIAEGTQSMTVAVAASATTVTYSLTGLTSDAASHTVLVSLSNCGVASATYVAPQSCTVVPPRLTVSVSTPVCNSATNQYTATGTVSLTNATAGMLTITDNGVSLTTISVASGQTTASFSVTGISNSSSHTVVATLTGGTSAMAVYTAPASCTAGTCPEPTTVCQGSSYAFVLSVPANLGTYQWYRDGQPITGATDNSYTATQAGSYSLVVNGNGGCINGSCCPVVILEVAPPSFSLTAQAPTCSGASSITNGQVLITGLASFTAGQYTYQYSAGTTFDPLTAQPAVAASVPTTGPLLSNLVGGQTLTVRVFNAVTGCYQDQTTVVPAANCTCPPAVCVPFVIRKVR